MSDRLLVISTLLLLLTGLLTTRIGGQAAGEGDEGSAKDDSYDPELGDTLTDDEDFSRLAAFTLHAHSTKGCYTWQETDVTNVLRTVKNKMILYVEEVCGCIFDTRYVSRMRPRCSQDINTPLKVDTNITVPYSQNYDDFLQHFSQWILTTPSFTQTLTSGARTKVTIVHLETSKSTHQPPEVVGEDGDGSGEISSPGVDVTDITVEPPKVDDLEVNSSVATETSICLLTVAFLLFHFMAN